MGLEEGVSGEELDQNTANTPDVTREAPAEVQYDFRSPVVTGRHNRGVIFIIEGGRTKIDEPNFAVEENAALSGIAICGVRGRRNGAVIGESLVSVADEEDIFRFKVSVDKI